MSDEDVPQEPAPETLHTAVIKTLVRIMLDGGSSASEKLDAIKMLKELGKITRRVGC